jgi:type II secretion system protein G
MTAKDTPGIFGLPLKDHGFTLVELIVVMAVLGVLATMAVPAYDDLTKKATISSAKTEIRVIEKAITAFSIDRNKLPDNLSDIGAEANIRDPWKHLYQYYPIPSDHSGAYKSWDAAPNQFLNDDFDLYSLGSDGATDNDLNNDPGPSMDDIIRVSNGAVVELGSAY